MENLLFCSQRASLTSTLPAQSREAWAQISVENDEVRRLHAANSDSLQTSAPRDRLQSWSRSDCIVQEIALAVQRKQSISLICVGRTLPSVAFEVGFLVSKIVDELIASNR
jgi:hypothetical protein